MNEWKILHFFPQNILNVDKGGWGVNSRNICPLWFRVRNGIKEWIVVVYMCKILEFSASHLGLFYVFLEPSMHWITNIFLRILQFTPLALPDKNVFHLNSSRLRLIIYILSWALKNGNVKPSIRNIPPTELLTL